MKKVSEGEVGGLKFILNFCLHRILAIQRASGIHGNDGNGKRKQKHGKYRISMLTSALGYRPYLCAAIVHVFEVYLPVSAPVLSGMRLP